MQGSNRQKGNDNMITKIINCKKCGSKFEAQIIKRKVINQKKMTYMIIDQPRTRLCNICSNINKAFSFVNKLM